MLPSRVFSITAASLLLQAVLDAYLCLVHLTLGVMVESLLHSFGTIAFMQFGELCACMLELVRLLLGCVVCGDSRQPSCHNPACACRPWATRRPP